jgi:hypothetical protein
MRAFVQILLILEVVVCFGPMTLILLMGALLVPIQIIALVDEPLLWEGPAEVIGMVLCGASGLATLTFLLAKIFDTSRPTTIKRPWLVLVGATIEVLPLLEPLTSPMVAWRILGAMPIVASLHVLFLSRRMLFPSLRKP